MLVFGLLVAVLAGCSRAHYRRQADREAYGLIDRGSTDPRWPLDGFTIEPDPRSRFFDPYVADCPPMPSDDPTSHELMHCVDGKRGWAYEAHYGRTEDVENPEWKTYLETYLPRDENDQFVLDRQAAMLAALLHSREYQQELENLYLSALDVTFERFRFDVQFFGGNATLFTKSGPLSGSASDSSALSTSTPIEATRLLATGGQLVVEVANSVVWQFSGADGHVATTPLDFSLVQPLLRGAGRAVVLEKLTSAERALLANIRQLERFRRGFYLEIIAGRSAGPGPSPGGIGLGTVSPGGGGATGGYLSLLQQQLEIDNQRANVAALADSLQRFEQFAPRGDIGPVQVDQIRQSLYDSQIRFLAQNTSYADQLDTYKITLGLPPQLDVKIEDSLLDKFNLIDPALAQTQQAVASILAQLRDAERAMERSRLAGDLINVLDQTLDQWSEVKENIQEFRSRLPAHSESLRRLAAREEFVRREVDANLCNVAELNDRPGELERDLANLEPTLLSTLGKVQYRAGKWQAAAETLKKSFAQRFGADTPTDLANAMDRWQPVERQQAAGVGVDSLYLAMAQWQRREQQEAGQWYDVGDKWISTKQVEWAGTTQLLQAARSREEEERVQNLLRQLTEEIHRLRWIRAEAATLLGRANALPPEDLLYAAMALWQLAETEEAGSTGQQVPAMKEEARRLYDAANVQIQGQEEREEIGYDEIRRLRRLRRQAARLVGRLDTLPPEEGFFAAITLWREAEQEQARGNQEEAVRLKQDADRRYEEARQWYTNAYTQMQEKEKKELRPEEIRRLTEVYLFHERAGQLMGRTDTLPPVGEPQPAETELQRSTESVEDIDQPRQHLIWLLTQLGDELTWLSLIQAGARLDAIDALRMVDLESNEALRIASENRRDWMNARAALVDQWRQIEVLANDLESQLDLVVGGNLTTTSDTLTPIHNTTAQMQVGFEFDAPLTRLAERNAYREVLISYQRARRQYYAFQDRVSQVLREALRSIHVSQLEFELQRAAVRTAINRVREQQLKLRPALKPGQETAPFGPTAARDLVDALRALLNAQNAFLGVWLDYQVQLMNLDFDLGTMPLDEQGMWPLDEQGMWILSEPLGLHGASPPEAPEELPDPFEIWPLPEVIEPAGEGGPQNPRDVRHLPSVHDADRTRRLVLR